MAHSRQNVMNSRLTPDDLFAFFAHNVKIGKMAVGRIDRNEMCVVMTKKASAMASGERIKLWFNQLDNGTTDITIRSESLLPTAIFDFGQHSRNIAFVANTLRNVEKLMYGLQKEIRGAGNVKRPGHALAKHTYNRSLKG